MKNSCGIIRDLLPLYHDDVCSIESKHMVEEHLKECKDCRKILTNMEEMVYDEQLHQECEDVVANYTKRVKRKSMYAGIALGSTLLIPIVVCLIVNLVTGNALDWFFIVFTSLMLFASLTVVPLIVENKKFLMTLLCSTISLLLLLLTCCLYTEKKDWFFVSVVAILFAFSVVFTPIVLYQMAVPTRVSQHKGAISLLLDTILFFTLIIVCGLYSQGTTYWQIALPISLVGALYVWILFYIIRYTRMNSFNKAGFCVVISGILYAMIQDFIYFTVYGVWKITLSNANLIHWNSNLQINANCYLLLLLFGVIAGIVLFTLGLLKKYKEKG